MNLNHMAEQNYRNRFRTAELNVRRLDNFQIEILMDKDGLEGEIKDVYRQELARRKTAAQQAAEKELEFGYDNAD